MKKTQKPQRHKLYLFGVWLPLLLFTAACQPRVESPQADRHAPLLDSLKRVFAPDKRVAIFDITLEYMNGKLLAKGKTDQPKAKTALLEQLEGKKLVVVDSVEVLPSAHLEGKTYGLVVNSVGNLRSSPKHSAELATQATLGMPLKVLERQGTWYRVQTPDRYIAWLDSGALLTMAPSAFETWNKSPKLIFTDTYGFAYTTPTTEALRVSDLVMGDLLQLLETGNGFYKAAYPDGRIGYIPTEQAQPLEEWLPAAVPDSLALVEMAFKMRGVPYLWGGTSAKGVDCSGFTKTIFFMNGLVIPRDASQQVHAGEPIDTTEGFEQLQVGDLLFFGRKANDSLPEKVVHVGMWIGNGRFIHASNQVRISSMQPEDPLFDAYERNRYLRAKRLVGAGEKGVFPLSQFVLQ